MYPSIINSFNRPSPTDRLNSPSHSALHNTVSSALSQVETVIGLSTSSAIGTLFYDIRSPASNGGGHIQTANKGGTGQTTYSKGDLIVATSQSVLSKLAVSSTTGDVLVVDPTAAAGLKWGTNPNSNKVSVNVSSVGSSATTNTVVLFSSSIIGSTLGTSNAVRFTGIFQKLNLRSGDNYTVKANYGVNSIATLSFTANGSITGAMGQIQGIITPNGTSSQLSYVSMSVNQVIAGGGLLPIAILAQNVSGTSSVESSANQDLIITGVCNSNNQFNSVLSGMFIVEKIT